MGGGWVQTRFYNPLWLSSELRLDSESRFEPSVAKSLCSIYSGLKIILGPKDLVKFLIQKNVLIPSSYPQTPIRDFLDTPFIPADTYQTHSRHTLHILQTPPTHPPDTQKTVTTKIQDFSN